MPIKMIVLVTHQPSKLNRNHRGANCSSINEKPTKKTFTKEIAMITATANSALSEFSRNHQETSVSRTKTAHTNTKLRVWVDPARVTELLMNYFPKTVKNYLMI